MECKVEDIRITLLTAGLFLVLSPGRAETEEPQSGERELTVGRPAALTAAVLHQRPHRHRAPQHSELRQQPAVVLLDARHQSLPDHLPRPVVRGLLLLLLLPDDQPGRHPGLLAAELDHPDCQARPGLEDGGDVLLDLARQQLEQVGVSVGQLEVPAHVGDQHHSRERPGNWNNQMTLHISDLSFAVLTLVTIVI